MAEDKTHLFVMTIALEDWNKWSYNQKKEVLAAGLGDLLLRSKVMLSKNKKLLVYYAKFLDSEIGKITIP